MVLNLVAWALDHLLRRHEQRTEVRLRVHRALLLAPRLSRERYTQGYSAPPEDKDCYFLNVWNASPQRRVQVTHVWVETPGHLAVLTRPLPVTIEPGEQWETWVEATDLPGGLVVEEVARAQLADGTVLRSEPRLDVPPAGAVPGFRPLA